MSVWLAVLKQSVVKGRFAAWIGAAWLVETAISAVLWPTPVGADKFWVQASWRASSILSVVLGLLGWGAFLDGLEAQLSPVSAQLVPRLRRTAVVIAIAAWLAMATALARETSAYGLPFPAVFAIALVGLAITTTRRSSAKRYAGFALLLVLGSAVYGYGFPSPGSAQDAGWIAWAATLMAIAAGAIFIRRRLGRTAETSPASSREVVWSPEDRDRRAQWTWDAILRQPRIFQWMFDRILHARAPESRLLHGLGPSFHWSQAVMGGALQAAPFCLITYVASRLLANRYGDHGQSAINLILMIGSTTAFLFSIQLADNRLRELWARHEEQAVLLLVPGVPIGSNLSRWLMQTMVLHHVIAIASALWFVTATALALGQPLAATLKAISAPLAASLLVTPAFVRDYASMRQPRRLHYTLYGAVFVFSLYWTVFLSRATTTMIVIVVPFFLSGILAAARYKRLMNAPAPFPVGRVVL